MGELHVKHPDIKVQQLNTNAPKDLTFKRFQKVYGTFPVCNYRLYEWPDELRPLDFLTTHAVEVVAWAEEQLGIGTLNQPRDDYR